MNVEELEKLNLLKEKGIITQEEFEIKKKEFLNTIDNQKTPKTNGINGVNVAISFLITIGIILLGTVFINVFANNTGDNVFEIVLIYSFFLAFVYSYIAIDLRIDTYKNTTPVWQIFVAVFLFPLIAVWIVTYQFLQIKQGLRELK